MPASLVSVIIPTYNRAYCLKRAVDSVLRQTHPEVEAIVVDDGSTDKTGELVSSAYAREPRVRYVRQANAGVVSARNRGLAEAQGDFIAFLDSDDALFSWKFAVQLACLRAVPEAGMIWTDMEAVGADGKVVQSKYLRTMYNAYDHVKTEDLFDWKSKAGDVASPIPEALKTSMLYSGDIFSSMILGNLVHTSTVLLTRERLSHVKTFNPELKISGEDYDFHLRTARAGRVAFLDVSSIHYQIGMADALTRPAYIIHLALNSLKTIEPFIQNDRARIQLSDQILQKKLIDSYLWIAQAYADLGQYEQARPFWLKALRKKFVAPREWFQVILSFLPGGLRHKMLVCYRSRKLQQGDVPRKPSNSQTATPF